MIKLDSINRDILIWARETAGFSLEEAAQRLDIKQEKLSAIEAGEDAPTRPQLVKMSKEYHRSLLIFYLNQPPVTAPKGQDFRSKKSNSKEEYLLDALIRDIKVKQELVIEILQDNDDAVDLHFIGSKMINDGIKDVAETMINIIDFDLNNFRKQKDAKHAFKYLRNITEQKGIFVIFANNLGSYHTDISPKVFRGYADANPIAPFIVINKKDAEVAYSFTLLHELTHLLLGQTGISGNDDEKKIEEFCNNVAGEILCPYDDIKNHDIIHLDLEDTKKFITEFAKKRHISRLMVGYNFYKHNKIIKDIWNNLYNQFTQEWEKQNNKQKNTEDKQEGGPNYYVVQAYNLGQKLVRVAYNALEEGTLNRTRASKILGVKPTSVDNLFREVL